MLNFLERGQALSSRTWSISVIRTIANEKIAGISVVAVAVARNGLRGNTAGATTKIAKKVVF